MPTLELRGQLNRPSSVPDYGWTTEDGIEVTVADRDVLVRWPAMEDEPDHWGLMQALIEKPLFAETLATDLPAEVQWTSRAIEEGDRRRVIAAFTAGSTITIPIGRLDEVRAVEALDSSIDLLFATWSFRNGLEHMQADDHASAMRSFYVACEAVVLGLRSDSREEDWLATARQLDLPVERVQHLYLSLQFARHANPSRSRQKLDELSLEPLSAAHCRGFTGDVLRAFAMSLAPPT
jgi:hypothetical protein